jgi:hypothetical protein
MARQTRPNRQEKLMSIIVTSWEAASLTLGSLQDYNQFLSQNSARGFEVKALSTTSHVEKNGNIIQFYNLVMQRPTSWSNSEGQLTYPQ